MACSAANSVARLLGPNLRTVCTASRFLLPSSSHLLHLKGTPAICYQQHRTKKTYKEFKFNKPLNFDHSGDTQTHGDLHRGDLLFKYKDIAEIQELPDDLKKIFTVEYATAKEKLAHRHMMLQDQMCKEVGPAHNLEKQIAYLTVKIRNLIPKTIKMRANKCQKVHLLERIAKRNKFLGYLRQLDFKRYEWIQYELGITYTPYNKYSYFRPSKKSARKQAARQDAYREIVKHMDSCELQFEKELKKVRGEKERLMNEIREYNLDTEKLADQFRKDMKEKLRMKPKMSPRFRQYEEERKKKKLEESCVV